MTAPTMLHAPMRLRRTCASASVPGSVSADESPSNLGRGTLSRARPGPLPRALDQVERAGSGQRPPIVYLHVWPDDTEVVATLVEGLTDRQVISIPRPPLSHGRAPIRYEEWVAHYAQQLDALELVDDGPLYLAGWSQGFLFCVDLARHRTSLGTPTSLIISLDSSVPWIEYDARRFAYVMGRQPSWHRRATVGWREMIMPAARGLRALALRRLPPTWTAGMRQRYPNSQFWRCSDPYLIAIYLANARHSRHYGRCGVDTLIVASERTRARVIDDDLGWHELLTGRIDVVSVPGGHWSFFAPPHAEATVAALDQALLRADERYAAE